MGGIRLPPDVGVCDLPPAICTSKLRQESSNHLSSGPRRPRPARPRISRKPRGLRASSAASGALSSTRSTAMNGCSSCSRTRCSFRPQSPSLRRWQPPLKPSAGITRTRPRCWRLEPSAMAFWSATCWPSARETRQSADARERTCRGGSPRSRRLESDESTDGSSATTTPSRSLVRNSRGPGTTSATPAVRCSGR